MFKNHYVLLSRTGDELKDELNQKSFFKCLKGPVLTSCLQFKSVGYIAEPLRINVTGHQQKQLKRLNGICLLSKYIWTGISSVKDRQDTY